MTENRPLISVLLPVRNASPWLHRTLRSLIRQTRTDFEVVAVDDRSEDGSLGILREFAGRDRRIRVVAGLGEGGLVAALNAGLKAARGRYLARCDADDLCHRDRLGRQAAALDANPEIGGGIVYTVGDYRPERVRRLTVRHYYDADVPPNGGTTVHRAARRGNKHQRRESGQPRH